MTALDADAKLRADGLQPSSWGNGPGDRYSAHSHDYDKVLVAARGSIIFHLGQRGRDIELAAGDRLDLPAGTQHSATVGPAGVTCLEAHLPAGALGAEPRHVPGWVTGDAQ